MAARAAGLPLCRRSNHRLTPSQALTEFAAWRPEANWKAGRPVGRIHRDRQPLRIHALSPRHGPCRSGLERPVPQVICRLPPRTPRYIRIQAHSDKKHGRLDIYRRNRHKLTSHYEKQSTLQHLLHHYHNSGASRTPDRHPHPPTFHRPAHSIDNGINRSHRRGRPLLLPRKCQCQSK